MNFDGNVFWHFLWYRPILEGAYLTLTLAVVSQALGIVFGLFLALGKLSRRRVPVARSLSNLFIWFFRGTPLLVQIIFVYDALPQITGQAVVLGAVTSGVIALSLNEGAYMAEIIRAGVQSVDPGQIEAAKALGMPYRLTMRKVVLPQAVRFVIPPTGNEFISMLKNTTLVSFVAAPELLGQVQQVYSANYRFFELLTVACVWYLVMTTVATFFQTRLERRLEYRQLPRGTGRLPSALAGFRRG